MGNKINKCETESFQSNAKQPLLDSLSLNSIVPSNMTSFLAHSEYESRSLNRLKRIQNDLKQTESMLNGSSQPTPLYPNLTAENNNFLEGKLEEKEAKAEQIGGDTIGKEENKSPLKEKTFAEWFTEYSTDILILLPWTLPFKPQVESLSRSLYCYKVQWYYGDYSVAIHWQVSETEIKKVTKLGTSESTPLKWFELDKSIKVEFQHRNNSIPVRKCSFNVGSDSFRIFTAFIETTYKLTCMPCVTDTKGFLQMCSSLEQANTVMSGKLELDHYANVVKEIEAYIKWQVNYFDPQQTSTIKRNDLIEEENSFISVEEDNDCKFHKE